MLFRGSLRRFSQFVPEYKPPGKVDWKNFEKFIDSYENILILTGAGVSTESGLPDYRSENVGVFARSSYRPIQYNDFLKSANTRRRFWARNFVGWPRFSSVSPNGVHFYISRLLASKRDSKLITQNVDGLHSKAQAPEVLELHGNAYWVRCINCGDIMSRHCFQNILKDKNPTMRTSVTDIMPDGDVEIHEEDINNFEVPSCEKCEGILKPTVVFFGQNISEKTVKEAEKLVQDCEAMLILGTSLSTLSSFRLVEQAYSLCKYLCIVNIGETKADYLADMKISTRISDLIFFESKFCIP